MSSDQKGINGKIHALKLPFSLSFKKITSKTAMKNMYHKRYVSFFFFPDKMDFIFLAKIFFFAVFFFNFILFLNFT